MKISWFVPLLLGTLLFARESNSSNPSQNSKASTKEMVVQGCVIRSGGDYILMKQDPAMTYQLQASGKIKLSHYLGQQVEVTGGETSWERTSSNTSARMVSASVGLSVTSIKTIAKRCSAQ
jgi:hypothetical protein